MIVELHRIKAVPTLMHWRREVLRHVFGMEPGLRLLAMNRRYYREHIADGSHVAYIAAADGVDAGCGGVCFTMELPSPDNPTGFCAYLMNIYVREEFRGHGIARTIVNRLIEDAKSRKCGKIYLETTDQARQLYHSLGFDDMTGMMKLIAADRH